MDLASEAVAKACCADLFQSDMARMFMGDSLHPGGLALTRRLGRLVDIAPGDRVLDLASARGASALAVSREFRCQVIGVEFGAAALAEANAAVAAAPDRPNVAFVRGDAESPPFGNGSFDHAICECSMSLFSKKSLAITGVARSLRAGGRLGLSDVTIEPGVLPAELAGHIGNVLCLTDALTFDGYASLMNVGGFDLVETLDASDEIIKILDGIQSRFGFLMAFQGFLGGGGGLLAQAPRLIRLVRELVDGGQLGYWLFVGQKRE